MGESEPEGDPMGRADDSEPAEGDESGVESDGDGSGDDVETNVFGGPV